MRKRRKKKPLPWQAFSGFVKKYIFILAHEWVLSKEDGKNLWNF